MKYRGSKLRLARHIVPILMDGHDDTKPYVEPFVGGGNLMAQVPASIRWGNDTASYAIELLDAIANRGYTPPEVVTEEQYRAAKAEPWMYCPEYIGFLAYSCSYGGKFWGGYARSSNNSGTKRNHAAEQVRQLKRQAEGLKGVHFTSVDYRDLQIPDGSTIYCDPPYQGTTSYRGDFDHDLFWEWVDVKSQTCRVFVSEYEAPDWCEVVWQGRITSSLTKNTGAKYGQEKLFKCHKGK